MCLLYYWNLYCLTNVYTYLPFNVGIPCNNVNIIHTVNINLISINIYFNSQKTISFLWKWMLTDWKLTLSWMGITIVFYLFSGRRHSDGFGHIRLLNRRTFIFLTLILHLCLQIKGNTLWNSILNAIHFLIHIMG